MILKPYLIDWAAGALLDKSLWGTAKALVKDVANNDNLTPDEKRSKVKQDLLFLVGNIGDSILHLAIELGVAWFKSQQSKQN